MNTNGTATTGTISTGVVVLISGRGSNLNAMCHSGIGKQIKCVISNNPYAKGLLTATEHGIPTAIINHTLYSTRKEFDSELAKLIDVYSPKLIVLAGFMRILTNDFVERYFGRLINIHPSILPAFPGVNAQTAAFNTKVKVSGATVHYVTPTLDQGPIIAQGIVPVEDTDTRESLALRILNLEHIIYPFIIQKILDNKVTIMNNNQIQVTKDSQDMLNLGVYHQQIFY